MEVDSFFCTQCCLSKENPKIVEFALEDSLMEHLDAHNNGDDAQVNRDKKKYGKPVNQAADMAIALAEETLPGGIPPNTSWEQFVQQFQDFQQQKEAQLLARTQAWELRKAAKEADNLPMPPLGPISPLTFYVQAPVIGPPQPASPKKRPYSESDDVAASSLVNLAQNQPDEANQDDKEDESSVSPVAKRAREHLASVQAMWAEKINFKKAAVASIEAAKAQIEAQNAFSEAEYEKAVELHNKKIAESEENAKILDEKHARLMEELQQLQKEQARLVTSKEDLDRQRSELVLQKADIDKLAHEAAVKAKEIAQIEQTCAAAVESIEQLHAVLLE